DDSKALFLAVPNIAEVMQMEVSYDLKTANGVAMKDAFWFTVNEVTEPELTAEGFGSLTKEDLVFDYDLSLIAANSDDRPTLELGEELFLKMGCIACHAIDDQAEGKIGPGMKGLFGSEREFEDSTRAIADEAYIRESIISPGEKIVKG